MPDQPPRTSSDIIATGARVLRTEGEALLLFADSLTQDFARAVEAMFAAKGRVIVSGMGKSGHIGKKIAATLASTGTPAFFVHPAEAAHGDLGMIKQTDVCLVLSNSGETSELAALVDYTRRFNICLIGVASRPDSTLLRKADIALVLPPAPEACAIGKAPTTSTTMTLALGDALAVALMKKRDFQPDDFGTFHPGGSLGAQLMLVEQLMHTGEGLPLVPAATAMPDALIVMSAKSFGVVGVLDDEGRLAGIITDGDLRRLFEKGKAVDAMTQTAAEVMHPRPRTISGKVLASKALSQMNETKITCLFVVDDAMKPAGLIHIHDCLRAGVAPE